MPIFQTHLAVVTVLLSMMGIAASSPATSKLKQSVEKAKTDCAKDIGTLCSDVTPGEGRLQACLEAKEDKLSPECTASRAQAKAEVNKEVDKTLVEFRKDCGTDVQKFCAEVPPGQGRLYECLDKHEPMLSRSCKAFESKLTKKLVEVWG